MRRAIRRLICCLVLATPAITSAQPAPEVPVPNLPKPLPKAPPVVAPPASARALTPTAPGTKPAPAEQPPEPSEAAAPGQQLPAGHPSIAPGATPQPAADESEPDSSIPAGSIVVTLLTPDGSPKPNTPVRLGILRQTVAEGESKEFQDGTTDAEGKVSFRGLKTDSAYSYRVSVKHDAANYAAPPFNLKEAAGQRVKMHIFPVTRDINQALVGGRSIIVTELRDDIFQFEVMFRIFNMGKTTWVPDGVTFSLPKGAKGFVTNEGMTDARVAMVGDQSVELLGTFQPGQHDVTFRFQVPNDHNATADFELGLPPHVAEVRVMAEAAEGMSLNVAGFDAAEKNTGPTGQKLLVTGRQLKPGEPEMNSVSIQLTGVPTPGPGRWIAAGLAAVIALAGVWVASRAGGTLAMAPLDDLKRARRRLLDELVHLETAHSGGDIGPKTYENAKKILLDALARVEAERSVAA